MRSIWRGALSFGLIHIPVRLYSASKDRELKFHLLHKTDLSEVRYARICKSDGKEIPWEDIVKGYEYQEGTYAVLTEEDFKNADPKKTKTIEILDFTGLDEIDPMYYETPYYLEPEKGAEKAYRLLREALQKSKKVAVGNYVLSHHEHIGVIKPDGDLLVLHQLRYHNQIVNPKELNIPKGTALVKSEVDVALQLIEHLTKPFHVARYSDSYIDKIKALIKQKSKGKKRKKTAPAKSPKVHDIMSVLKESLQPHQKKKKKRKAA